MPCLFTSSSYNIDVFWLSEVIMICPEGPQANPEVELHINGMVRPYEKKGCNLTFVHRGEIYLLKDRSDEWSYRDEGKITDWFCEKILNSDRLSRIRGAKPIDGNKMRIGCRTRFPSVDAGFTNEKKSIPNIKVFCADKDREHKGDKMPDQPQFDDYSPIFSQFDLKFEKSEMQLFRVSFRTKFGLSPYLSQVGIEIEGPESAIFSVRDDIAKRTVGNMNRRMKLYQTIDTLYDNKRAAQYDIILMSHPSVGYNIENISFADPPITFPIETEGTPISSAASLSRAAFFDMKSAEFSVSVLAQPTLPFGSYFGNVTNSPEINKDIEWFNRKCDEEGI